MPRATTKDGLIEGANAQFEKMLGLIDSMKETQQAADFCFDADAMEKKDGAAHWKRDKNLRDVLAHLYEWHQLFLSWEHSNAAGESKPFLPAPYSWKTYGAMNTMLWEKHQTLNFSLSQVKTMLQGSHDAVLEVVRKYSDTQLFTKALYSWTGTSCLGQYCVSVTASHYDWAIKKLKEQLKAVKGL